MCVTFQASHACYSFFARISPGMDFHFSLLPRDEQFCGPLCKVADEIQAAAVLLEEMLASDPPDEVKADAIRDAEHRCDALTHDTIQRLHRTFVTPFDREDLY